MTRFPRGARATRAAARRPPGRCGPVGPPWPVGAAAPAAGVPGTVRAPATTAKACRSSDAGSRRPGNGPAAARTARSPSHRAARAVPAAVSTSWPSASSTFATTNQDRTPITTHSPIPTCQIRWGTRVTRIAIRADIRKRNKMPAGLAHRFFRQIPRRLPSATSFSRNGFQVPSASMQQTSASAANGAPPASGFLACRADRARRSQSVNFSSFPRRPTYPEPRIGGSGGSAG